MNKEEVRKEIERMDDAVLLSIIDCCKELQLSCIPMFMWGDRDAIMDMFDNKLEDF